MYLSKVRRPRGFRNWNRKWFSRKPPYYKVVWFVKKTASDDLIKIIPSLKISKNMRGFEKTFQFPSLK